MTSATAKGEGLSNSDKRLCKPDWNSASDSSGKILGPDRKGKRDLDLSSTGIATSLKALQKDLKMDSDEQPLSGHSFRVGAALDLLEQGEPLERVMLRGGWQTDSTAMKYLRNWVH